MVPNSNSRESRKLSKMQILECHKVKIGIGSMFTDENIYYKESRDTVKTQSIAMKESGESEPQAGNTVKRGRQITYDPKRVYR